MKYKEFIKIKFDNKILFRSHLQKLIRNFDNLFFIAFKYIVSKYSPITKNSYIYPLIRYN